MNQLKSLEESQSAQSVAAIYGHVMAERSVGVLFDAEASVDLFMDGLVANAGEGRVLPIDANGTIQGTGFGSRHDMYTLNDIKQHGREHRSQGILAFMGFEFHEPVLLSTQVSSFVRKMLTRPRSGSPAIVLLGEGTAEDLTSSPIPRPENALASLVIPRVAVGPDGRWISSTSETIDGYSPPNDRSRIIDEHSLFNIVRAKASVRDWALS